jgi:CheY-like chemotaxis protein
MVRKLLMVDDDADDREVFQLAIADIDSNIQLTFAHNGMDALKQLEVYRPDAIFLDCLMPGMDGIECLTKLKSNKRTRQIPVVIYTGSLDKDENELVIRLGAFQLVRKSTQFTQLRADVKDVIVILEKRV